MIDTLIFLQVPVRLLNAQPSLCFLLLRNLLLKLLMDLQPIRCPKKSKRTILSKP